MATDMVTRLEYLACIRLDVNIWSARAKLKQDDLPPEVQASLPPDTLATLGTKRLFDPSKMKVFNTLKARAVSILDKKCVRFLGGWATHEDILPELASELAAVAADFYDEKNKFMASYVKSVAAWVANFPGWENILLNAVPKSHELGGKFAFTWQMFRIQPETSFDNFSGNNLTDTIVQLENDVFAECAKAVTEAYKECFHGKDTVTKKAFRPLRTLHDKVRGLGFIHNSITALQDLLYDLIEMGEQGCGTPGTVDRVKRILSALSVPHVVQQICNDHAASGNTAAETFDPFWDAVGPSTTPTLATPTPPPGWGAVLKPMVDDAITKALDAIDDYQDRKLGIDKSVDEQLSEPVNGFIDGGGLW